MKIVETSNVHLKDIAAQLKKGKTIVYPTETCYGLGCDATNVDAVGKIFHMKQRQKEKSVLILMSDIAMADDLVQWNPTLHELATKYWPGPLTIVAPLLDGIQLPPGITAPDGTIAFRVTSHPIAHEICSALDGPIVSTSANIHMAHNPYDVASVVKMFETAKHKPDIIIDAGPLAEHAPSTIVAVRGDGSLQILRQGELIIEHL